MKIDFLENQTLPIGSVAPHSLNVVAELVQDFFTRVGDHHIEMSYWQRIFMQSRANGCSYDFEALPHVTWRWPHATWFQERFRQKIRDGELAAQRMNN